MLLPWERALHAASFFPDNFLFLHQASGSHMTQFQHFTEISMCPILDLKLAGQTSAPSSEPGIIRHSINEKCAGFCQEPTGATPLGRQGMDKKKLSSAHIQLLLMQGDNKPFHHRKHQAR